MSYSYHSSLAIGTLLHLVGLKECGLGTQSLGMGWTMSDVGTRVGAEVYLFQSSPLPPVETIKAVYPAPGGAHARA